MMGGDYIFARFMRPIRLDLREVSGFSPRHSRIIVGMPGR